MLQGLFTRATGHLEGKAKGEVVGRHWEDVGSALMKGVAAQLRKGLQASSPVEERGEVVDEAGNMVLD
jgi:hypothetical protein